MEYTKYPQEPSHHPLHCTSIAMLNGKNGEKLVALAIEGGYSPKLAVWNPNNGLIEAVLSSFPAVTGMVSVNRGEELIVYQNYGSWGGDGIYKYVRTDNFYTHLGQLLNPRSWTVVLPVTGMSCP